MPLIKGRFLHRKWLTYGLKILVAAIAFVGLLYLSKPQTLGAALSGARYWLVALASLTFIFGQFLAAWRWYGVLRTEVSAVTRREIFGLNLIGTCLGNFLPGQGSGDLVKSAFLFSRFPERRAFLFASVVYDRVMGMSAMLVLAAVGIFVLGVGRDHWVMWFSMICLAWVLVAAFGSKLWVICKWCIDLLPLARTLTQRIAIFSLELRMLFCNKHLLLRSFVLSLGFQLSWVLTLWIMLNAILPGVSFLPVVSAAPLSALVASIPVSLGGLGIREGAFSLLMQRFGVPANVATAAALLTLIPLFISSFMGAILLLFRRFIRHHQP